MNTDESLGPPVVEEEEGGIDLRHYGELLLRHWKLLATCAAVGSAAAILAAYLSVPLYRAVCLVSVERDKLSLSDVGLGQSAFSFQDPDFLTTQLRIIRGRDVLESVISRRQLLKKGKGTPADEEALQLEKDRMAREIGKGLMADILPKTTLIQISYMANTGREAAEMANAVAESFIDWNKQARIDSVSQVTRFLEAQIEQLKKDVQEKEAKLAQIGKTKEFTLESSATAGNPKLEAFNKDYAAAVAERINKDSAYQQVMAMRPEDIADQDASVAAARAEQQKLEREYAEKLSIWKPDFPAMKQLKARIEKGQKFLETTWKESAAKARDKARIELDAARKREEVLRGVVRAQMAETLGQTVDALEFSNMRVEISASRTLLDSMLKRQAEADVAVRMTGSRQPNVRIIERAAPPEYRLYPSYKYNLQIGVFAGLAFGISLIVLIDRLDRSVRTQEQVEKFLQLPALGIIPAVGATGAKGYGYGSGYGYGYGYGLLKRRKKGQKAAEGAAGEEELAKLSIDLIPHEKPRTPVSEAYRAFRALLLLSRAGGVKALVITSALPGEGKTTTALNLAVVLAQLGKKVLLVDGDLHKPRAHKVLKLSNKVGLVSHLAEGRPLKEVLQATQVPNLWCVTAGPMTPNPSGLLSSDAMASFRSEVAAIFEFVVYDSPPVQPVADALLLGAVTDGVVLTVLGGKTSREIIKRARRKLLRGNVKILGVLVNNLQFGRGQSGEYGSNRNYQYGYGYGYGYGESRPETEDGKPEEKKAARA